jgi:high-affinity nickel-transport protein
VGFANPVRKVYYNLAITGLSVAVALLVGTIELITVLHDKLHLTDPITGWIAGLSLDNVGLIIVGLFIAVWTCAIGYWRVARVEDRWQRPATGRIFTGTVSFRTGSAGPRPAGPD